MRGKILFGVCMTLGLFAGSVSAADPRSASMLGNTCAGCHGTLGAGNGEAMPTIAGFNKSYLETVMTSFADETRPSTIMGRMARGYSDLEIKAMASFFAQQPWANNAASIDTALATKGKTVHEAQCATCHGTNGDRNNPVTPRLAGQWPQYLYNQMKGFAAEDNRSPMPSVMRDKIRALSDDDMHALAQFYASQK